MTSATSPRTWWVILNGDLVTSPPPAPSHAQAASSLKRYRSDSSTRGQRKMQRTSHRSPETDVKLIFLELRHTDVAGGPVRQAPTGPPEATRAPVCESPPTHNSTPTGCCGVSDCTWS